MRDGRKRAAASAAPGGTADLTTGLDTTGSLQHKVVRGASWSAISKLGAQGLQFAVGLVLARILLPEQFGLIASVYVITGFSQMLFELGLGAALIQMKNPSQRDMSTVFWINALSGVVFAGVLTLAAPLVADFYGEPELRNLTPIVALAFTFSIGVVHNGLLARQLRFKTSAGIELSSSALGHTTSVVTALLGAGPFALAYGGVVTSICASAFSFVAVRWLPRHFISRDSLRRLWRFSGGMLGFNVVNYWGRNADNLLVGRFLGAAPLGLYNRAYNLMLLPINQVTGALGRVMFPALAAIQGDHARVRSAYLRTLRVINAVTFPILVGLLAVSDGLVPLLWGPNWSGTVPLLQILCLAGLPQCLSSSIGWIYQSQGRTTTMFVMGVIGTVVGVAFIVVGLHWGAIGVAWGVLARYWVMAPVGMHVAGKAIGLRSRTVFRQAVPTCLATAIMGGLAWGVAIPLGGDRTSVLVTLVQVAVGAISYPLLLRVLAPDLFREVVSLVLRRGRKVAVPGGHGARAGAVG